MSAFFLQKVSIFWQVWYLYSKQWCESGVRDFLVLFSVFVTQKITINENDCVHNLASGLLQIGHKSQKIEMKSQFTDMTSLSTFFKVALFPL